MDLRPTLPPKGGTTNWFSAGASMKPILLCFLLSLFGATPPTTTGNPDQSAPAKVILDTDIGDDIDDAWALAFILAHKNFDLLGVTITHGNTPARAPIAAKMLHITKRDSEI